MLKWKPILGTIVFFAGVALALYLTGFIIWGELEARFRSSYSGEKSMPLECPHMIAPGETAQIYGNAINLTGKEIKPVVYSEFVLEKTTKESDQTLILAPGEDHPLQWSATSADSIFDKLILVNVRQSPYRDNPSRWGSCGIVIYSLLGMNGAASFGTLFVLSILALLSGGWLWYDSFRPLSDSRLNMARLGLVLAGLTVAALVALFFDWWGLALVLDVFNLLAIGTAFVDIFLFAKHES